MCFMNFWEEIVEIRYFNYISLLGKDRNSNIDGQIRLFKLLKMILTF